MPHEPRFARCRAEPGRGRVLAIELCRATAVQCGWSQIPSTSSNLRARPWERRHEDDRERLAAPALGARMALTGIWYIVGFAFAAGSFAFLTFGGAWLVSHRNRGDLHKGLPYESGIDTYGD